MAPVEILDPLDAALVDAAAAATEEPEDDREAVWV
jgi:hypothetical protein